MRIRYFLIQLILLSCICLSSEVINLENYSGVLAGGTSDTLDIDIDSSTLDFGTYNYEMTITENGHYITIIPIEIMVIPIFLPAPQNLQINVTAGVVFLSWEAVNGSEGYKIYRSIDSETGYIQIGTSSEPSFTDPSGSDLFFYRVTSYYTETRIGSLEND
jgi:hypothetical protein